METQSPEPETREYKTPVYTRRANTKYYYSVRNDPEKYEEYKKKKREYQREYYRKRKEAQKQIEESTVAIV